MDVKSTREMSVPVCAILEVVPGVGSSGCGGVLWSVSLAGGVMGGTSPGGVALLVAWFLNLTFHAALAPSCTRP
ncbi:hypothetical protein [Bifidobacterium bombi]|uniref:Uncharacterized protein n=1 Tax=Bifidobacterium bombi DSM 19703 TaxID=1341695 RepID=A0A086BNN8_9BIFI|nr:hypothetical protein [Bifidobacterium bombi]KFF30552.1 hypothetical protein BBOMB_1410 [Bifidobacterium bombi DSM 19703]